MRRITTRADLIALAAELGVRPSWHEPDERGVSAEVRGHVFDNAGFWPEDGETTEMHVVISHEVDDVTRRVAAVNLATLLSWAADPDRHAAAELQRINDALVAAGNEHPLGYRGVRDVLAQRDGVLEELRANPLVEERVRAWQAHYERGADAAAGLTARTLCLLMADAVRSIRHGPPPDAPAAVGGTPESLEQVTRCRWTVGRERCVMWRDHAAAVTTDRRHMTRDGSWHREGEGFVP